MCIYILAPVHNCSHNWGEDNLQELQAAPMQSELSSISPLLCPAE